MAAGLALATAACGPGYRTTRISASAQLGPGIDIYSYSASQDGDWHANYRQWTPVTVYEMNGSYYPNQVKGGREVQVYRTSGGYMLPPQRPEHEPHRQAPERQELPNSADYSRAQNRP